MAKLRLSRRDVRISGPVVLGEGVSLGEGTILEGAVTIGEGAVLGERCRLIARERIEVGRRALLGDGVVITDFEPNIEDPERPTRQQGLSAAAVSVGAGARVGHGACLLPGARVEPGGAVAPNTVLR